MIDKVGPAADANNGNQSCGLIDPKAEFKKLQTDTNNFIKRETLHYSHVRSVQVLPVFHLGLAFLQDVCTGKSQNICEKCLKCLLNVWLCETQKAFKVGITLVTHVS